MSQTAIPLQFEKYLQNQLSVGKAPDMNEMIFAYIPNLDPSQPIDRNQGLPAVSTWVYQQDIDQEGKLGDNALVYSVVIPGSVAAFTFNAIYLRDKNVPNSCGIIVHKATETKEAGMASTKSLMQQYTGAAQIAGITVDAQTWQIDYQARLLGIEDDMRLANLDNYGHTAFIQGFDVTQQADPAKYKVAPGVVYVGGLRAELKNEVIQTISAKPTGLYIDVVRTGTVLSKWQNIVTVRASATPLTDYVDQNQQQHYVARLAGINANGSVEDWREKGGLPEHEADENPHPQYMRFGDEASYFASIPIGMEVAFDTPPPTNDPRFRFVKLTYNDAYNTGLLTSQTLSGRAPELVSTAVISAAQSPINGQTIYLKNTMSVYAVPAVTQGIVAQNIPQPARYRIDSISPGVSLQTGPSISGFIITSAAYESQITGGLNPRSFGEVLYKRIY
ncbi:phage tail-collar fiber domain-containing protein [Vibrio cholerae]|uniref:phage tail-collar fiber domain-containing protein n=1 Tax=Vibrio cholerae TaxID=666 RepID=UPI00372773DB